MATDAQLWSERATYSFAIIGFIPAATPTDIFTVVGNATTVVRISRIQITGVATAASEMDVQLVKRTAANSGGTATQPAICLHDSGEAAPQAVLNQYGANPAGLGAGIAFRAQKLALPAPGGTAQPVVWEFPAGRNGREVFLRGAVQALAINMNGGTVPAGCSLDIEIEWTEVPL